MDEYTGNRAASLVCSFAQMTAPDESAGQRPLGRPALEAEKWEGETDAPAVLPDGYVRRSPVQAYRVPVGYRKRLIRTCIGWALLALLAALLVVALVRNNYLGLAAW